jgi:tetraprenyl-beta-curcumene synthase
VVVRALVAFHVAYNYLDLLAEQPHERPAENARRLHEALLIALDVDATRGDYYALHPCCEDGGYLAEVLDVCRGALRELPAWPAVAAAARMAGARIVEFQSMSLGTLAAFEQWARAQSAAPEAQRCVPDGDGLRWWELGAACGSSLGVDVLIAAGAVPSLSAGDVAAIERAYFPCTAALHSLLDSLIDTREDAVAGQLSLVGCYPTRRDAATRMRWLTERAMGVARTLPDARRHELLLTAMACQYLSAAPASMPARAVREALGWLAVPVLFVFKMRRLLERAGAGAA